MTKIVWIIVYYSSIFPPDIVSPIIVEEIPFETNLECVTVMTESLKGYSSVIGRCIQHEIKIDIEEFIIEQTMEINS